jgi:hypothetical protein
MTSWTRSRSWLHSPAVTSATFVLLVLAAAEALRWFTDRNATNDVFVASIGFRTWTASAAIGLGLWAALFGWGIATIRGLGGGNVRPNLGPWVRDIAAFTVLVIALLTLLALPLGGRSHNVPVRGWAGLIQSLVVVGAVAASPWLLTVWRAHERMRQLRTVIEGLSPLQRTDVAATPTATIEPWVSALLEVWATIERCVLGLALLELPVVLNTGALRIALIDTGVIKKSTFPPSAVIAYGAIFAVVLAVAVIPLIMSWRSAAADLVDRALGAPPGGIPDETWQGDRERLVKRLHLDVGVFRDPLTSLSLLTPLLSALVTAFLPSAGS